MSLKKDAKWLALSLALISPLLAYAAWGNSENENPLAPYLNITAPNQIDGISVNPNIAGSGNFTTLNASGTTILSGGTTTVSGAFTTTGTIPTQGVTFTSALSSNPLTLTSKLNTPIGAVNTGTQALIAGSAGRTIYPAQAELEAVGGTTATCTSIKLLCSPSLTPVSTYVVANLTSGVPSAAWTASNTAGAALVQGCSPGDSVLISAVGGGGCATSSSINSLIMYTVQ